ncbi:DNA primase [Candidatus Parabeggiatoa sp. HSG14]|uniref:DNA primase n=1 Tax=Candidatus Parabeggiatoa sp. HSG14 TaxID=3055593 RepID=UPI0025A8BEFD|nr:DNA primase [Thiotrichales bacterium HSG14]
MRISRSFIDELMSRVDIVDLIDSYVSLRKTGQNFKACCPFHTEKTPSFTVSPDKQFYYCFGCGVHGSAIGFLMDYAHLDFMGAVHELASRIGMEVVYEQGGSTSPPVAVFDDLYQIMAQAAQYYRQQLRQSQVAIDYLKKRGLTGEIARDFGLGYAPQSWNNLLKLLGTDSEQRIRLLKTGLIKQNEAGHRYDHFRDRIMFPILDRRGRVIAFGGRLLVNKKNEPKYLNSPETPLFQKGHELYGWYLARKIRPLQKIIIVEGYMDVVALAQYGIRYAVATLGTAASREHLTQLFRSVPEIIFCFDGDEAGQKAAWRALETVLPFLQEGHQVNFVFLPQGYDPDDLVRQEGTQGFNSRLDQATPLSKFLFDTLTQQVDMNSLDGRARLVELAKPFLKRLPLGIYLDLILQQLSELTHVNLKNLATLIQKGEMSKSPFVKKKFQPIANFGELSLVHKAIVCLLHKPELSQSLEHPHEKLSNLKQQNIKLLLELIEFTRMNPKLTLGAICEHWRGTSFEQIINHLAAQNTHLTDINVNIDKVFFDAINRLYEDDANQRFMFLTQKITELTIEEKQELKSIMTLVSGK